MKTGTPIMLKIGHPLFLVLVIYSFSFCQYARYQAQAKDSLLQKIENLAVLPLDIQSLHFTSGGIHEYNDAKSTQAKAHFKEELEKQLSEHNFNLTFIDTAHPEIDLFRTLYGQYLVVDRMIRLHVYGPQKFFKRINDFDYTLGSVEDICQRIGVDGLFIIWGFDEQMTKRRRKMIGGAAVGSAFSLLLGMLIGIGGNIAVPRGDACFLSAAIIGKDGKIIWYNYLHTANSIDISQPNDVQILTTDLLEKLNK